jgi:integrase
MPKIKITKANMTKMEAPEKGQLDYYDTELPGFGVRVTPGGGLTFMVYRRVKGKANKTYIPIGGYGAFTPEQARAVAKEYIRRMELGENPHPKHRIKLETITLETLLSQYFKTRKTPLSASSEYQYNSWMKNCFSDWQKKDVASITGSMIATRLQELEGSAGSVQAINAVKLLGSLYRFGIALYPDVIRANPVDAVKAVRGREWSKRERRKTVVANGDLPAWYEAVTGYSNPTGRDYLLFILFTGLRKMEAATLTWADVDLKAKTFTFIPEKKRGEKPENARVTMPMSHQLYRMLKKRRALFFEGDYLFPGRGKPHVTNPRTWTDAIKEATGIQFCLHDLRRTFITVAESLDISHYSLKALLNHSLGNDVTGGYVVITPERLREPMQKIADRIMELAAKKPESHNEGGQAA